MIELSGGQLTIASGIIALLVPCLIFYFRKRTKNMLYYCF